MRNRPSTIDRLAPELRDLIAERRQNGATIDEIRAELAALGAPVGRTALGNYVRKIPRALRSPLEREMAALRAEIFLLREALARLTAVLDGALAITSPARAAAAL